MSEDLERVRAFVAAWKRNDLEEVMSYFAEDCVYHNMPVAPVRGREATRAVLESFSRMATGVEWVLHQIAETDRGVVLTERTDRFAIDGRWVELPVMGP